MRRFCWFLVGLLLVGCSGGQRKLDYAEYRAKVDATVQASQAWQKELSSRTQGSPLPAGLATKTEEAVKLCNEIAEGYKGTDYEKLPSFEAVKLLRMPLTAASAELKMGKLNERAFETVYSSTELLKSALDSPKEKAIASPTPSASP